MNQKPIRKPRVPAQLDVFSIRARTRYKSTSIQLTQANFARAIGVSAGTLRHWEQHRRKPTGAARVLLALLNKDPDLVSRLLAR